MADPIIGRLVAGEESQVRRAYERFEAQPVTEQRLTENKCP